VRLAILSDIHGNLHALEAVLGHLQKQQIDQLIVAGDIVNGMPHSKACFDLVMSLNAVHLRGNHERYVYDFAAGNIDRLWTTERFAPLHWTVAQVSAQDIATMRDMPLSTELDGLFITHSAPTNDYLTITADTDTAVLREHFSQTAAPYIVRGHNHHWVEKCWDGRYLLSIDAAGLPLGGSTDAQFVIAEKHGHAWQFLRQSVPYNLTEAVTSFETSGYLAAAGPIARLFLEELKTARWHLVPFFRRYGEALDNHQLNLAEAVTQFLGISS
jgi:predicted phosphodiesterase